MNNHPLADMLTRIRNASARHSAEVKIPPSRFKEAVGKILVETGWIRSSETVKPETGWPYLLITLKYNNQQPIIRGIQMLSKSGQRLYLGNNKLTRTLASKLETVILSTSRGLLTASRAKNAGLGGEALFKIW